MRSLPASLRVCLLASTGLAVLLTASACGGGGGSSFAKESAKDIVAAAKKDTTSVTSVHLVGDVTSDGKDMAIDLKLDDKGDCVGTIKLDGGSSEILGAGGKYWIKPDAAFWQATEPSEAAQIIAAVGDKYVSAPSSSGFSSTCDLNSLFSDDDSSKDKEPVKGGTSTIDGQETVKVTTSDDDGNPAEAYILTSSPHYVVRLVGEGDSSGNDKGSFTLSGFGDKFAVTAPAASDVFDLSSLGG